MSAHTPGDPMPCAPDTRVIYRTKSGGSSTSWARHLECGECAEEPGAAIIAWASLP